MDGACQKPGPPPLKQEVTHTVTLYLLGISLCLLRTAYSILRTDAYLLYYVAVKTAHDDTPYRSTQPGGCSQTKNRDES